MNSDMQSCNYPAVAADLDSQIEGLLEFAELSAPWHLDAGIWEKNTALVHSIPVHPAIHIQNQKPDASQFSRTMACALHRAARSRNYAYDAARAGAASYGSERGANADSNATCKKIVNSAQQC